MAHNRNHPKPRAVPKTAPELALPAVMTHVSRQAALLENQTIEAELVRARLADGYRAAGKDPWMPEAFDRAADVLDADGWRRLGIAVALLDVKTVAEALAKKPIRDVASHIHTAFFDFVTAHPLLTAALLRQSGQRTEEFARSFARYFGCRINGETPDVSDARLQQLDYHHLLDEAESARQTAQERMEYLKNLHAEQREQRRPRGKH